MADAHPAVPALIDRLEAGCLTLAERADAAPANRDRLATLIADLRWYADRLGAARWELPPRPGRWSLAENVAHIAAQAQAATAAPQPRPIVYYIDHGKEHVGQAAEIYALFEY